MSRANFADPVTLVRSPTFTNRDSSLRYKGSRPLRLQSLDTGFLDLGEGLELILQWHLCVQE